MGTLVTAAFHVKVPPRHNGVFQVKVHGDMDGNYIITSHPQWEEKNPNVFQHEMAIVTDDEADPFLLAAVTKFGPCQNSTYWKRRDKRIRKNRK